MNKFKKNGIVVLLAFALVLGFTPPSTAQAATTPSLGAAASFGVLSSTFTNSNTAPQTIVNGDVGYTVVGAPVTPPITVTGTLHPADATHAQAGLDQGTALGNLNGQTCTTITGPLDATVIPGNAPGVFPPGCYTMAGALVITLSTSITLDLTGPGGVGNTWIFKSTGGGLTTGSDSFVTLANGASACDVFWVPVGAANIGAYTGALPNTTKLFIGNIIDAAGIGLGHFANLSGRALAFGGTVTTDANTITVPTGCSAPVSSISPSDGTINVVKTVVNDSGGTKTVADFPLFVNGTQVMSGVTNNFPGNSSYYTVTETNNTNYTQTFSSDCDSNGQVRLNAGNNKFCIITNNDIGAPLPVVPPLIEVLKTASPLSLPLGPGPVTYTYTARNIGTVPMSNVTLVGDTCSPVVLISGDTNNDGKLDVNETWVHRCSTTLSATHTNTVVATGWANGISATDIASATVVVGSPIVPPLIHIVKKPNLFIVPVGGLVTYSYTVTNPGTAPLSNVTVTDDKCTGLPGRVVGHPGDLNNNNLLESNESWSFTCKTKLTQTTTNIGTARGTANGLTATDFALATVVVTIPKLPKTGFAPKEENSSWNIIISAGILGMISAFYLARKKQTN